ncbi:MAG: DUF6460 domain-containing protein [Pseudomonadota bacterium]
MRKIDFSLILKLGIASLIVGTVLAVIDFNPIEFWKGLWEGLVASVEFIFGRGLEGLKMALQYTLIGALVVVPIWLFSVLFKRRNKEAPPSATDEKK